MTFIISEHTHGIKITVAANKGIAIAGIPCFVDTFVQGESSPNKVQC